MTEYFLDQEFTNLTYDQDAFNLKEFEQCTFRHCDLSACNFIGVTFIDCHFYDCHFNGAKINHVALRTVGFYNCQMKEINFSMCDKLIFEIAFTDCILDFSKFYTLKIKDTVFRNCSLIAVDFMNADLTSVIFDACDLYRSEFEKAIAVKANFKTSFNYTIDPQKTKVKNAIFSLNAVKGLLYKHDIIVIGF
ncbi:pentapeptide repeat-containing protein [Flavobacterium sp.]|uniref:pentapeptide repeat-containing protein n=1 Tax=Flavobacterium sp. TaxID=239 RepID=UPI00286AAE43|nr:pentapeptide repeat-containing protein [Flavobacterium sp.]